MTFPIDEMLELFHSCYAVDAITGCWVWNGQMHKQGYGVIDMKRKGTRYRMLAHRFSLKYVGKVGLPDDLNACHHCDNRPCVNPEHLFHGTQKQNMEDCVAKGRQAKGGMLPQTKLSEHQVHLIWSDGRPYEEIASDFGTHTSSVANIKAGKEWAWLTAGNDNPPGRAAPGDRIAGEKHYAAKLTEADVIEIRLSVLSDCSLADLYRVRPYTIQCARTGMTWRRVPMPEGQTPKARHAA